MKISSTVALIGINLLVACALHAQTPKPGTNGAGDKDISPDVLTITACDANHKPDGCVDLLNTGQWWTATVSPQAEWHDYIDKKGVYHSDFTDPNNVFRCTAASYLENGDQGISFTITCAKPHKVETR